MQEHVRGLCFSWNLAGLQVQGLINSLEKRGHINEFLSFLTEGERKGRKERDGGGNSWRGAGKERVRAGLRDPQGPGH